MNPLLTVIGHGKVQAVFQRHLLFWKRHQLPILVCCPKDDPLETEHEKLLLGESQGAGPLAHLRLSQLVFHLSASDYTHHVIFEYDSLCLKTRLDFASGFFANVKNNAEYERFIAHRYANFPWMIDTKSLRRMVEVAIAYPNLTEYGHNDRWMSALSMLANVPLMDFSPKGASAGVWDDSNFKELAQRVKEGSTMLHGIKSEWIFEYLRDQATV